MGELDEIPKLLKAIVAHTPKTVIAMISSNEEAAIRVVGIPLSTPYPSFYNNIHEGTRIAGLTAPKQKPSAKARGMGSPMIK